MFLGRIRFLFFFLGFFFYFLLEVFIYRLITKVLFGIELVTYHIGFLLQCRYDFSLNLPLLWWFMLAVPSPTLICALHLTQNNMHFNIPLCNSLVLAFNFENILMLYEFPAAIHISHVRVIPDCDRLQVSLVSYV